MLTYSCCLCVSMLATGVKKTKQIKPWTQYNDSCRFFSIVIFKAKESNGHTHTWNYMTLDDD